MIFLFKYQETVFEFQVSLRCKLPQNASNPMKWDLPSNAYNLSNSLSQLFSSHNSFLMKCYINK